MSNYSEIWDGIAELQTQRAIEEKRRAKLTEVERLQEKLESQEQGRRGGFKILSRNRGAGSNPAMGTINTNARI